MWAINITDSFFVENPTLPSLNSGEPSSYIISLICLTHPSQMLSNDPYVAF